MDLLEKASIILTPTAYNNGEALCVKPSDGSGDFDFSRNSAATRVNAQGLVENVQILSSNLVQNGDFSEEGVQEISNGSFSQEGSELITNGDFSNGSTDWNLTRGNVINDKLVFNTTGQPSGSRSVFAIQNNVADLNKIYKVEFTISDYVSGQFRLRKPFITSDTFGNGTYTYYGTASEINFELQGRLDIEHNFSIDNVSVREVGQDWTLGTGWSIGENKAVGNLTGNTALTQSNILTVGKIYKIEYTISDYVSGNFKMLNIPTSSYENSNGTYTIYGETDSVNLVAFGVSFVGSITNISVKEVGQNWSFVNADISIGNDGLEIISKGGNRPQANQNISGLTIGNKYKLSAVAKRGNCVEPVEIEIAGINSPVQTNKNNTTEFANIFYEFIATSTIHTIQAKIDDGTSTIGETAFFKSVSVIEITDDTSLPRINYEGFSYQDALGSELVTNGDFSNGTAWTLSGGATISDGKANIVGDGSVFTNISQGGVFTNGKQYVVKLDVIINSGLGLKFQDGANNENIGFATTSGTYTFNFTATSNSYILIGRRTGGTPFNSSIDNVSVKEYLGQEPIPNSGCGHWLWEPQSTNLLPYSKDFSQWQLGSNSTLTYESNVVAPDGSLGVYRLTLPAQSSTFMFFSISNSNQSTCSVYAKSASANDEGFNILLNSGSSRFSTNNEWQRFEFTDTSVNNVSFINSGDTFVTDIYIWGAQLEQQSYATSYIPTNGEANGVTRNQDVCTNGGSLASINSTEGVLYAEIASLTKINPSGNITLTDGTGNNRIYIYYLIDNSISVIYNVNSTGASINNFSLANITDQTKIAVRWGNSNVSIWINGASVLSNTTSNFLPNTLNVLSFSKPEGSGNFFGKTKALAVWKEALSDEELQSLTTI